MSTEEIRTEPTGSTTSEPKMDSTTGAKAADINLADELREFGKQIEGLFQTARTSTRGKDIETQLTSAWRDVEKGVNGAINKAQSTDFSGTVQGTARYAADEAQNGLARGLRGLNQWLAQKKNNIEDKRKTRESDGADASKMADNPVADRFGEDAPVFGQDIQIPIEPDPKGMTEDNPIADRFGKE